MKASHSALALFLIFACVTSGFAQSRRLHIPSSRDGGADFWYTFDTAFFNQIGLFPLHQSPYPYHFRVRGEGYALDIWQTREGTLEGQVVNWVKEYTPPDEEPTNRFFHLKMPLDSGVVYPVFRMIQSSGISLLPDQSGIPGWQDGLDGVEYIIEHADANDYYFKTYWTPAAQDSLKEAQLVQGFIDNAFSLANEMSLRKAFASQIPFESYYTDPSRVAIRVDISDAQRKQYRNDRELWRKRQRKGQVGKMK